MLMPLKRPIFWQILGNSFYYSTKDTHFPLEYWQEHIFKALRWVFLAWGKLPSSIYPETETWLEGKFMFLATTIFWSPAYMLVTKIYTVEWSWLMLSGIDLSYQPTRMPLSSCCSSCSVTKRLVWMHAVAVPMQGAPFTVSHSLCVGLDFHIVWL